MIYTINCVCGEKVAIEAASQEEAIDTMVAAMDAHVAATPHPQVPADLSAVQKMEMVKQQMTAE